MTLLPRDLVRSFLHPDDPIRKFNAEQSIMKCRSFFEFNYVKAIPKQKCASIEARIPFWFRRIASDLAHAAPCELKFDLLTGDEVDPRARLTARRAAAERPCTSECKEVLFYLNNLPPSLFSPLQERVPAAMRDLEQLERRSDNQSPLSILTARAALNAIRTDPQPIYAPSPMSARISPLGYSFVNLKGCIRDKLTEDWTKIDINHCHLEIVAALWGIDELSSLLRSGEFWTYISEQTGVLLPAAKKALKKATYSAVYGASRWNISRELISGLGNATVSPEAAANRFLGDPVIKALLAKRNEKIQELAGGGVAYDAFGKARSIQECRASHGKRDQARTILACVAQSYEFRMMARAVRYAMNASTTEAPIYVAGWAHDGAWLAGENLPYHARKIEEEVRAESLQLLGSEVRLKIEHPLSPSIYVA